jgi:hypothetical protein
MGGDFTEEKVFTHAQYLDMLYYESGTLYDMIPHASRSLNDRTKLALGAHVDGIISSIKL